MSFMVFSRFHTLDRRFYGLTIISLDQFNVSLSQYFLKNNMTSNMSPFKYFNSILAITYQISDFLIS
jgi:hypothetical protein